MSIFLICYLFCYAQAKDLTTINFIKSYIQNEYKPTDLIYYNLGWNKNALVGLARALSLSSVRTASVFRDVSSDQLGTLFLVDLDTGDANILNNATKYLRSPYRWLVLSDSEEEDRRKFLWDLPLLLDSDFVLAVRYKHVFTLTELYKPSTEGPTYSQMRGYYNSSLVDTRARREMYRRRGDVMGHELIMTNVIQESNATMYHLPREDRLYLQNDAVSKMSWVVARLAFEMVNATPKYIFSHTYGYKTNGVWSGLIHDLITGKAVMGTNILMKLDRLDVISYADPLSPLHARFLLRQPLLADVSNIFTLPFSINVWIATIVSAMISVLTLYLDSKWEASRVKETRVDGKITDAMLITMGAISGRGSDVTPKTFSGRLIFWLIFFSMMIIYTAYSANIFVLLQAPSNAIRTIDQLAKSKIPLGALDFHYNNFIFKRNKDIQKRMLPEHGKKHLYSLDESIYKLRRESYAIHGIIEPMYRRIEKTFLETEKCDLTAIDFMNTFDAFTPVQKNTPYIELFRVSLKRISEAGLRVALRERYNVPKPKCNNMVTAFSSIGIQNIQPVLLLVVLGVAVSLLILILEVIVHKITVRQQQRKVLSEIRQKYTFMN